MLKYDCIIIGAGLSGLSAAWTARERGLENILLLEQNDQIGGFTLPYQESPLFKAEKELVQHGQSLEGSVRLRSTVIGLYPDPDKGHTLFVQSAKGTEQMLANSILMTTGAMEKPREGWRIPGSRPSGVMTPYLALELLQRGFRPGKRTVVFETGRIAESAGDRLDDAGCMTIRYDKQDFLTEIMGIARLEAIRVVASGHGRERKVACDTLIYNRGRYAATYFTKGTPLQRDADLALLIDDDGCTGIPGVYAAGTCTSAGDADHTHSIEQGKQVMTKLLSHCFDRT
ncbi:thioredoxin reductase [Paenibacillus taihuensis]|uniref:Thioredoxin reductase n=1 Tax=Paenibacillus taihuensis TaxID=1156355 RepID=A0A3D9R0H1_9BACL|nr:FAD-dependent oxidoreductase [Paenibacillus taihuensis]REE67332.1 thioredoxin reductase [Paenibacillus taihuensis]